MFLNIGFWIILLGFLSMIWILFKKTNKMKKSRIDKRIESFEEISNDYDKIEKFEKKNKNISSKVKKVRKFKNGK